MTFIKKKPVFWWGFFAFGIPYTLIHILNSIIGFHYNIFIDGFNALYFFIDFILSSVIYGTSFYWAVKLFIKRYDDKGYKK